MSKKRPQPERATWPVDKLRKHRLQDQYFGRRSDEDLQELAEAIRRNGMHPIDVLPNGRILSGHQRWYIARYILKWVDVPVNIRHDLLAQGEEACDQYFRHANMLNREPTMLQKARAFALDCELEEKRRKNDKSLGKRERLGRVRDAVAKRFGKAGRTLAEWVPLVEAPKEVQAAVEDKRLSRQQAIDILAAPADIQATIVKGLAEHKTASKLLKLLGPPKIKPLSKSKLTRHWRELNHKVLLLYKHYPASFEAMLPEQRHLIDRMATLVDMARDHLPPPTPMEDYEPDRLTELINQELGSWSADDDVAEPVPPSTASTPKPPKPELVLRTAQELAKPEKPTLVLRADSSAPKGKKPRLILVRKDAVA